MRIGRWVWLVAGLAACGFEPAGDVPISAPDVYREWYAKTEACSGLTGSFDRIKWYEVPGDGFDCPSGRCAGRWNSDHHIYISAAFLEDEMVVRHEMLHELIGHPGHPDPPFGKGCPLTWATWSEGN
jgi:hypothetical protein